MVFPFIKSPEQTIGGVGVDFAARFVTDEIVSTFTVTDTGGLSSGSFKSGTMVLTTFSGGIAGDEIDVVFTVVGTSGTEDTATIRVYVEPSAALCVISANLRDLGQTAVEGIPLTARLKFPVVSGGAIVNPSTVTAMTDENGQAYVTVPQGVEVDVTFAPLQSRITLDTTGLSAVNLSDYMP